MSKQASRRKMTRMDIVVLNRKSVKIPADSEARKQLENRIAFSPEVDRFERYLYRQFDFCSSEAGPVVVALQQALLKQAGLGKMFAVEEIRPKLISFQEYLERAFPVTSDQVADISDALNERLLDIQRGATRDETAEAIQAFAAKLSSQHPITSAMSYTICNYIAAHFFPDMFETSEKPLAVGQPIPKDDRKSLHRLEQTLELMGFDTPDIIGIMNHVAARFYTPLSGTLNAKAVAA